MEFPSDILTIIKEYSMPITRSDWRSCGKIRNIMFIREFAKNTRKREFALLNGVFVTYIHKSKVYNFKRYHDMFVR